MSIIQKILEYKITESIKFIWKDSLCIIANMDNGRWVRVSDKTAKFIEEHSNRPIDFSNNFFKVAENNSLEKVIEKLIETEIILLPTTKENHAIDSVYYIVTERCNLSCLTCALPARPSSFKDEYSVPDIMAIISKIAEVNPRTFVITGGEPLLRGDIVDIIQKTAAIYNGHIALQTNGTLITSDFCRAIKDFVASVEISLDGSDSYSSSLIRSDSSFERAVKGINLLQESGIKEVSTSFVVTKQNVAFVDDYIEMNKKLGTSYSLREFFPLGRGWQNKELLQIPHDQPLDCSPKWLNELRRTQQATVKERRNELKPRLSCAAGEKSLMIKTNGDVYPCGCLLQKEMKIGNVLKSESLYEIIKKKNNQLIKQLSVEHRESCKDCEVKYFCIYCPAGAYANHGCFNLPKEECLILKDKINDLLWCDN